MLVEYNSNAAVGYLVLFDEFYDSGDRQGRVHREVCLRSAGSSIKTMLTVVASDVNASQRLLLIGDGLYRRLKEPEHG